MTAIRRPSGDSTTWITSTIACAVSTRWRSFWTTPDAVELAIWFHDAVYDVGSATNERRSAEMFIALSAGARFGLRHRVCSLIMATRHAWIVQGNDRSFMVDIDLSGFGAPWDEFIASGARLREESSGDLR